MVKQSTPNIQIKNIECYVGRGGHIHPWQIGLNNVSRQLDICSNIDASISTVLHKFINRIEFKQCSSKIHNQMELEHFKHISSD